MANIDDFNRFVLEILDQLYESFPQGRTLSPPALGDEVDENARKNYVASVRFLADEGLVRMSGTHFGGHFEEVRLTAKGLAVLDAVPDALRAPKAAPDMVQERKTVRERISEALRAGGEESAKAVVRELIAVSVRILMGPGGS